MIRKTLWKPNTTNGLDFNYYFFIKLWHIWKLETWIKTETQCILKKLQFPLAQEKGIEEIKEKLNLYSQKYKKKRIYIKSIKCDLNQLPPGHLNIYNWRFSLSNVKST